MIEFVVGILVGVGAWFITGVDDFLIILYYMGFRRSLLNNLAVVGGTIVAVIAMLGICVVLDFSVENTFGQIENLYLLGVIPVALGTYGLIRWVQRPKVEISKRNQSKWERWIEAGGIGIASFLTYLGNSTDDVIVNTSILQSRAFLTLSQQWQGFITGILLGALLMCGIAYLLLIIVKEIQNRFNESSILQWVSKYFSAVINIAVILVGLMVLLDLFTVG